MLAHILSIYNGHVFATSECSRRARTITSCLHVRRASWLPLLPEQCTVPESFGSISSRLGWDPSPLDRARRIAVAVPIPSAFAVWRQEAPYFAVVVPALA